MDIWITAQECIGLPSLPAMQHNIRSNLDKLANGVKRKRAGTKAWEYPLNCLPPIAQSAFLKKQGKILVGNTLLDLPKPKEVNYCPEALWANFDKATTKQKEKAKFKTEVVIAAKTLVDSGIDVLTVFDVVAQSHNCNPSSVRRWLYQVKGFEQSDFLPVLLDKHVGRDFSTREAEMTPKAWDFFVADYLRPEKPAFNTSYYLLCNTAKSEGWTIPSASSLRRKLFKEIPQIQQILLRDGEHAVMRHYPAQQRSVKDIQSMEWINGDGYKHNVFVKWYNGEIIRPKTWIWQDIRTRKILGYRCDISENTDSIRLSLADVIQNYGIPKHLLIDNTTAAANKKMTGGEENRNRYAHIDGEAKGIIPMLGIQIHWTTILFGKGHGQAKPIERAFSHGGLGELVDKHPLLAGFYTGPNPMEKPDNYNHKKGIDIHIFLKALEDGINKFNARPKRDTEICQGILSFDEAFNESYKNATIRKATLEQYRLLLLTSETVTLKQDGTFELKAGQLNERRNRYYSEKLIASRINKIVARFDPQSLHSNVLVYTLDGRFLCEATCMNPVAFNDTQMGREHGRQRTQLVKNTKKAATNQKRMGILEVQALIPSSSPPNKPDAKVIEPLNHLLVVNGDTQSTITSDPEFNFEEAFAKGLNIMKAENERGY